MAQIASYFARTGVQVDTKGLAAVDKYLKQIEAKMQAFTKRIQKQNALNIGKIVVDQSALRNSVQRSLDSVARSVQLPIQRFKIDQNQLNRSLTSAVTTASRHASRAMNLNPNVGTPRGVGGAISSRHAALAGGMGGVGARLGLPFLTGAGGVYGLAALNRRNQEVISAQLTTQAVTEASGLQGQGPAAFKWLENQGNRIGFNYLDSAQDYNNFLSNSLGAGQGLGESQDIFLGFAEYQRAMGITPARQKLVLNALSQMQGKGAVSMEELRRQMAESLPGTMSIFADAYQQMTGGDKTGQESIAALLQAVPTGKVRSSEILPLVATEMRKRAAPKLDVAMKTSQAEQARTQNSITSLVRFASDSGVESGFTRFFRTMNEGLSKAAPLVKGLAGSFNDLTRLMEAPMSLFADFNDLLKNVSETTGISEKAFTNLGLAGIALATKWGRVASIFALIAITLQDISMGLQGKDSYTKDFIDWVGQNSTEVEQRRQDPNDPLGRKGPLADFWQNTVRPYFKGGEGGTESDPTAPYKDKNSIYYGDPKGWAQHQKEVELSQMGERLRGAGAALRIDNVSVNVQVPEGADGQAQGTAAAKSFQEELSRTMQMFPNNE